MIKISAFDIYNIDNAVYGMRLPMKSHNKSDSSWNRESGHYVIGENDLSLMKTLMKAGSDHRKFLRQIMISITTIAPMYWELERDTYKVATTKNSSSKMHKILSRHLTVDDFSLEDIETESERIIVTQLLNLINNLIDFYKVCSPENKEKTFRKIIALLPESFNYECVWTGTLENLMNVYFSRKNHKLREWRDFCKCLESNEIFSKIVLE